MVSRKREPKPPPKDRIAVDTGVWLEGLIFGGAAEDLVKGAVLGRVTLLTSEPLLAELVGVLRRDFEFSETAATQLARWVREVSEVVHHAAMVEAGAEADLNGSAPDCGAAAVLRAAERGGATAIATTHRRAHAALQDHGGIPVVHVG